MGGGISAYRAIVAQELVANHSVLRLFTGDQAHHLHNQRNRFSEHEFAQVHEESWSVPKRLSVTQTVLFGVDHHCKKVDDAGAKLEACAQTIYHSIWVKDADKLTLVPLHKIRDTL